MGSRTNDILVATKHSQHQILASKTILQNKEPEFLADMADILARKRNIQVEHGNARKKGNDLKRKVRKKIPSEGVMTKRYRSED
jgi:hypothetical protein